jgi:membrane protease subunit (stomatin/prohibitin family)
MGLLAGMAKTAVVAGTAQATRNTVNRRQAERNVRAYSEAQQQVQGQQVVYAQPQQAAPEPQEDPIAQLERLGALRDQGILTEEEFQAQKAKILGT